MATNLPIGRLRITRAAEKAARKEFGDPLWLTQFSKFIARHIAGDWGDLDKHGKLANDDAAARGGRVFSAYEVRPGLEFWVITEADRKTTTILLPTDY